MTKEEENQCIQRTLDGDLTAFAQLIEAHESRVFPIALSMTKDPDDAKDVLQEAYINAYRHIHRFNHDARFYTWLYRIVVNQSLKFLRKKKRATDFKVTVFPQEESSTNLAIQKMEQAERSASIQKVMKHLKSKEALMLHMYYLMELSIQEIHESTGFSLSNIKVILHRARANFSYYYNKLIHEEEGR